MELDVFLTSKLITLFTLFVSFANGQIQPKAKCKANLHPHSKFYSALLEWNSHIEDIRTNGNHLRRKNQNPPNSNLIAPENLPYVLHHNKPTDKVVVLTHGLSDSPHTLRQFAELYFEKGYNVIGLLLTGHGSSPNDLTEVTVDDWKKDINKAVHIANQIGTNIELVGFSTGGALSIDFANHNPGLIKKMVLLAPAIDFHSSVTKYKVRVLSPMLDIGQTKPLGGATYTYDSIPENAIVQLNFLMAELNGKDNPSASSVETLLILNSSDKVINNKSAVDYFDPENLVIKEIETTQSHGDFLLEITRNWSDNSSVTQRISEYINTFIQP